MSTRKIDEMPKWLGCRLCGNRGEVAGRACICPNGRAIAKGQKKAKRAQPGDKITPFGATVLVAVAKNPNMTTGELAERLGEPFRVVEAMLKHLADAGYVEHRRPEPYYVGRGVSHDPRSEKENKS